MQRADFLHQVGATENAGVENVARSEKQGEN